jgi:uncharacterized SAM-binding protein YcdF (DUF218 family)
MWIALKSLLHTLLLPPAGPLLLALAGACLIGLKRGAGARRVGWSLLLAGLASLWLLSTPLIALALASLAQRCPALDPGQPVEAQAIVILGSGLARPAAPEYGGAPAAADGLLERVAYAAFLARRSALPVLVSGELHEAQAMRATLARDFGIETRWVEERSRDTYDDARFSAQILRAAGIHRVILVTSAVHVWRAAQEFRSAGLVVVAAPEGGSAAHFAGLERFLPSPVALAESTAALHELLGEPVRRVLAALGLRRQAP